MDYRKGAFGLFVFMFMVSGVTAAFCSDSDGGADFLVQGTTENSTAVITDFCASFDPDKLFEFSCVSPGSDSVIIDLVDCPGGCVDGACVTAPSGSGPVFKYSFENDFLDTSGNGYHATGFGATFTSDGPVGNAAVFDGSSYVALPYSISQKGEITEMTACAWFKTSVSGVHVNSNFALLDFDNNENFNLYVRGNDGKPASISRSQSGSLSYSRALSPLADDEWHHFCVSYDGVLKNLYVDGVLDGSQVHPGSAIGRGRFARFGMIGDGSKASTFDGARLNSHFEGGIDEVVFYDVALTDQEILDLYNEQPSNTAICDDSDAGLDLGNKGTVIATGFAPATDSCVGNEVVENYCVSADNSLASATYLCPNGCVDGACVL